MEKKNIIFQRIYHAHFSFLILLPTRRYSFVRSFIHLFIYLYIYISLYLVTIIFTFDFLSFLTIVSFVSMDFKTVDFKNGAVPSPV